MIFLFVEAMKLSIITVNLNNKDGLQKTIDSVLSQTYKDFEWIVIDGGSTDGSKELIEKFSNNFSYWVSEPDKGIYNAMNKGIKIAKGDYLLFLNSGDELFDEHVLADVDIELNDSNIILGQVERLDNHQLLRKCHSDIFMQLYIDTLNHQGSFIKRSLFKEKKYDESLRIVSDWKFFVETIIFDNVSYKIIDTVIARQDMGGISSKELVLLQKERQRIFNDLFPPLLQIEIEELRKIKKTENYNRVLYIKKHSGLLYKIWNKITSYLYSISIRL